MVTVAGSVPFSSLLVSSPPPRSSVLPIRLYPLHLHALSHLSNLAQARRLSPCDCQGASSPVLRVSNSSHLPVAFPSSVSSTPVSPPLWSTPAPLGPAEATAPGPLLKILLSQPRPTYTLAEPMGGQGGLRLGPETPHSHGPAGHSTLPSPANRVESSDGRRGTQIDEARR